MMRFRRVRLWVAPIVCCALDAALTLIGQPDAYWAGERGEANEANPLGRLLLHWHPLAFAAGALAAMLFYALLLERLPWNLSRVTSFVILFSHSMAAAMWCVVLFDLLGYVIATAWLLLASWLLGWSWRDPQKKATGHG
jgi:hypothetical protein